LTRGPHHHGRLALRARRGIEQLPWLSISGAVGSGRGMTIGIDLLRKDKGGNPEAQRMTVDVSQVKLQQGLE